jgi:hypothetical protein
MMGQENGLGPLQMRVTGQDEIARASLGLIELIDQAEQREGDLLDCGIASTGEGPWPTWSLRLRPVWILAPRGPGELGGAALNRHMDVLVAGLTHELAGGKLRANLFEDFDVNVRPQRERGDPPDPSPRT